MKDLPHVYQNEIKNKINNVQDVFTSSNNNVNLNKNISKKELDLLLNDRTHISKMKVKVYLKNGNIIDNYLISRNEKYIIFMDNTKILISDISDIKRA